MKAEREAVGGGKSAKMKEKVSGRHRLRLEGDSIQEGGHGRNISYHFE